MYLPLSFDISNVRFKWKITTNFCFFSKKLNFRRNRRQSLPLNFTTKLRVAFVKLQTLVNEKLDSNFILATKQFLMFVVDHVKNY